MNESQSTPDFDRSSEIVDPWAQVGQGYAPKPAGKIELFDVQRLWQRTLELSYWLIGIVVAAVVFAIVLTLLQSPLYRATSQIEISRVDSGAVNLNESVIEGEARDAQYYQTQYVLLGSRALAERVVEANNLTEDRDALTALGLPQDGGVSQLQVVRRLQGSVTITPLERSNLVNITVRSGSAAVSADIANSWAEQFVDANFEKRFGDNRESRRQLENQLAEIRERLETSEADLIAYANANDIVVLQQGASGEEQSGQQTLVESQLAALNTALSAATARRIAAESATQSGPSSSEQQRDLRGRIAEVEATLARLRTSLGPENSQVRAAEAELRSLRDGVNAEGSLATTDQRIALRGAQREEAELQRRFNEARQRYREQRSQGVQYGILEREVSTNRELYNAILQRYRELGVQSSGRNNIAVIDRAEPPSSAYSPSLVFNLIIALLLALAVCLGLVLARDFFDDTVRDPSELRRRAGISLLGLIPRIESEDVEPDLRNPHSTIFEAYASARVALESARANDQKIILITSTTPDEGKSLSSLALAHSLARLGRKVILIDMDLRRKGLSIRLNEVKDREGVATYLSGQSDKLNVIHKEDFDVDFVRAGTARMNPADILSTTRAEMLMDELRTVYEHVIIDAPPILGLADTPQLASAVDGLVYIVQANKNTFRSIDRALSRLGLSRSKLLGAIVTKIDRRNESYSYGYGYGQGYGYGYGATPQEDAAST